ncbi:LPXTG cell wall anchor domain-containing protein, partial [Lactobacillus sp. YT155]|uniref:LPXTG cell wall anchor domain-containing protein n=1 Tax=Lactobacillus sp. YT155 TaxID=3060955 RepID=UPI00265FCFE2
TTFAEVSDTVTGTFTNDPQNVKFVYTKVPTPPVDPTEPTKPTKPVTKTIVNTIVKKVLPKTGENNALNMALLASGVILLSSVVGYTIYKNKKKVN